MRISKLIVAPNIPAQMPRIKYRVPISLWLVEYSQRICYIIVIRIGSKSASDIVETRVVTDGVFTLVKLLIMLGEFIIEKVIFK